MSANVSTQNQETGYAKLNLALHIRGRRPDGYHELETIFAFVDQGDIISVSPDRSLSLTISGPFADGLDVTDNLVMSAAKILQNEHDRSIGAKLHLVKNLPVASGIGGGSADAAATMRLLNRHWALCFNQDELERLAMPLGADVPACIASNTVIGKGIGQDLLTIENDQLSDMHVLLANPLVGISTGEIFQKWDGVDLGPLCSDDILQALSTGRNDLQPIAMAMEETIDPLLTALMSTDPISAKMSGSGATCFGIYDSRERAIDAEVSNTICNRKRLDNDGPVTMNKPFEICGIPKESGILVVADHASNNIPDGEHLGISNDLMDDHIAYDIGTTEIARSMSENTDYLAFLGGYSRLIVDLNRYPDEQNVIPIESDGVEIPGNNIGEMQRMNRLDKYFHPYHDRLTKLIGELKPKLLVSLHSFTPTVRSDSDIDRSWDIGILYNEYEVASKLALQHLETEELIVGDQLPYSGKDLNATMNRQAEAIGQPYFGVEIRQDLISFETGQQKFAEILQRTCNKVLSGLA